MTFDTKIINKHTYKLSMKYRL